MTSLPKMHFFMTPFDSHKRHKKAASLISPQPAQAGTELCHGQYYTCVTTHVSYWQQEHQRQKHVLQHMHHIGNRTIKSKNMCYNTHIRLATGTLKTEICVTCTSYLQQVSQRWKRVTSHASNQQQAHQRRKPVTTHTSHS